MKITVKLFLTLIGLTACILIVTLILVRWSFQQGFLDFIAELEQTRMRALAESLVADYQNNNESWDFLSFQTLDQLALPSRPPRQGRPPPPRKREQGRSVRPQDSPPTALLAIDGTVISGSLWQGEQRHEFSYPNSFNGTQIAELRSWPSPVSANTVANKFMAGQLQNSLIIGLACLLLASLVAAVLTSQLVKPIRLIHSKITQLNNGDYKIDKSPVVKNEIGQLTQHIELLADTLDKTRETKNEWFACVSHELRTPLTVLKGEIEALEAGIRPFNQSNLKSLKQEISLLEHLINDLYQLSLSNVGGLAYHYSEVSFSDLLQQTCEMFIPQCNDKKIQFNLAITPNISGRADPTRLSQLFLNLINNAVLYTNSPGVVYVSITSVGDSIQIQIEDSAPAVEPEHYARLFDPLFRTDQARTRTGSGAGLGLSICKNIVTAHQGDIFVEPSQYGGITISIYIPRVKVK
ncbi:ATP-binding protein [Alteromonas sp. AMM-1]|uniref:ATP-binding protein n=1 Tax=Alteromonas sp. AMM-1 TaxID=3394233 RepID=UPI0039A442D5